MTTVRPKAAAGARPTMSRRHAIGAGSARGLLFTVLGELVLPSDGSAWTSAFIDVLRRLGVEEKTTRQALMRTAADGWLNSQRDGRRTIWTLSPDAEQLLRRGAERIYGFRGSQQDWDGRWLLALARPVETDRKARHLLRTRLRWAGLGSAAPGVWISTHADRVQEVQRVLDLAGVHEDAQIFVAEHRDGELKALIRQAWDLDAVEASYQAFIEDFGNRNGSDPLAEIIELVHAWRRFPTMDPALPARLLPPSWSGGRAAELFRDERARWLPEARREWRRLAVSAG